MALHVVWDWNGTLIADLALTIESVNRALGEFGRPPITADDYRAHYQRPVVRFYERLLGRVLDGPAWDRVNHLYHDHYEARVETLQLEVGARAALGGVAALGHSQSLLSMWGHESLVREVGRHEIGHFFARVDGHRERSGDTKAEHLAWHLERLGLRDPARVLVVGDALDDVEAARAVGARSVLLASGTHHPERLRGAGVPVFETLAAIERLLGGA